MLQIWYYAQNYASITPTDPIRKRKTSNWEKAVKNNNTCILQKARECPMHKAREEDKIM